MKTFIKIMSEYQKEISKIEHILKENPKGMTVTDIARKIKTNRNSVAKYLDIMRISGLVEMITFGPAKVFFPARRVPITNMLNFTSDYIMVFDKDLKIVLINNAFLGFMGINIEEILGQYIENIHLPMFDDNIYLPSFVKEAFDGKEIKKDIISRINDYECYFKVRIIPTVFEDGQQAVALLVKDTTAQRMVENGLQKSRIVKKNRRK
jgi:transcriptional regulator with PAS, ATPase and Fis domain